MNQTSFAASLKLQLFIKIGGSDFGDREPPHQERYSKS